MAAQPPSRGSVRRGPRGDPNTLAAGVIINIEMIKNSINVIGFIIIIMTIVTSDITITGIIMSYRYSVLIGARPGPAEASDPRSRLAPGAASLIIPIILSDNIRNDIDNT